MIWHRILTYSHYKNTYTAKILIGCTPSGFISFVSKAYGGRASDSHITKESGVLSMCLPYTDQIMVDKGFLIEHQCDDACVRLVCPPFLKQRQHMSEGEALANQQIARARVHVECAIQRVKAYKILQQRFPTQLLPVFDNVLLCGLVNLSRLILSEQRFLQPSS